MARIGRARAPVLAANRGALMSNTVPSLLCRPSLVLLASIVAGASAQAATPITGRYVTQDGAGIVEVAPCGPRLCGRLVRILKAAPGAPATDVNNRDPGLRSRPIRGLPILVGFTDRGADWRGTIYDPRNGKTYKSIVTRNVDGSLKVQGCIAFFCQTQIWASAR